MPLSICRSSYVNERDYLHLLGIIATILLDQYAFRPPGIVMPPIAYMNENNMVQHICMGAGLFRKKVF